MDNFSVPECREITEVIRQIILLMQMVDQRTVLPIGAKPKASAQVRKPAARKTKRLQAKTSKAMVCPLPKKALMKRKPKAIKNHCDHQPGYVGPVTRSMTAQTRATKESRKRPQLVRRRAVVKKPNVKKQGVRKTKARRQNRKRPGAKQPAKMSKCFMGYHG